MLLWLMLLVLGEGSAAAAPTPDVAVTNRRKVGAFVKRGGVGRLRRGR